MQHRLAWLPSIVVAACVSGAPTSDTPAPTPAPAPPDPELSAALPPADAFLARLETLMAWPRALGDPRRSGSIDALAAELQRLGAHEVGRFAHVATDPATGRGYDLVELVATFRPAAARRFVLATHFDTRPWADEEPDPEAHDMPVPGANDGSSGIAVIFELAPVLLRALPADVGMTVILFDGEELGRPGHGGYCKGSRHLADEIAAGAVPMVARAQLGIVLDMVGDADLRIRPEPNSKRYHPELVSHVWATAQRLGHAAFDPSVLETGIVDDHAFLTEAGVPSILVIDYDYPVWHTRADDMDAVSGESMRIVADVVLHSLATHFAN